MREFAQFRLLEVSHHNCTHCSTLEWLVVRHLMLQSLSVFLIKGYTLAYSMQSGRGIGLTMLSTAQMTCVHQKC